MNSAVEIDLSEEGENLYIFFGGIAAGIAMPPFEFYNASRILDESKMFFRDFSQSWYQGGLAPISTDVLSTAKYIDSEIKKIAPQKVYFVGNSMGGFAAIMFSTLVQKGEVIAFSPQTFISPVLRYKKKDGRWKKQVMKAYRKSFFKNKVWDLRKLMLKEEKKRKISIHVSREERLDHLHAMHIADIPGVKVHEYGSGGHDVVKLLKSQGQLPKIMSGEA